MLSLTDEQVEQVHIAANRLAISIATFSDVLSAALANFARDIVPMVERYEQMMLSLQFPAIQRAYYQIEKAQLRQKSNDPRIRSGLDEWLRIVDKVVLK